MFRNNHQSKHFPEIHSHQQKIKKRLFETSLKELKEGQCCWGK